MAARPRTACAAGCAPRPPGRSPAPRASTLRVSRGSITPSSSTRALVENTSIWPSNTPVICAFIASIFSLSIGLPRLRGSGLGDDRHGFGGLLAAHHGGLGVGPGEAEARMEAAAAHAVIAGAERRAAIDRDLRHGGRGHRLDHLRAVLDHAGLFIGLADHVAGGVVEIEQRRARLAAGLDEMRRLVGAGNVERAVVGDDADRLALDAGVAADGGRAVIGAELGEIGIVDEARDRLAHVDRPLVVHRHDAEQFFRVMPRRAMRGRVRASAGPIPDWP